MGVLSESDCTSKRVDAEATSPSLHDTGCAAEMTRKCEDHWLLPWVHRTVYLSEQRPKVKEAVRTMNTIWGGALPAIGIYVTLWAQQ
jgi:hypothetical protein